MFKAIVVICAVLNPNQCLILGDELGPYESKSECVKRVEEIAKLAPEAFEQAYDDAVIAEITGFCTQDLSSGPTINI